ncbi:MAG: thiolase family protein [Desulfobacterales bacterium]|nr:thiolase family protein [Desulfobacterales bacterium]MCP4161335.1 thiolase family protein [Deltaproteobacteria bacterium]
MEDVVIVSGCRTAVGTFGGTLKNTIGAELASVTMKEAIKRAGIEASELDDVRYGCCIEHADTLNVTRVGALLAGIPETVPAVTINRVCISGMEAVISGMASIQAGMSDAILVGGVEHMSGVAYTIPAARWGARLQDTTMVDTLIRSLHCGSHVMPNPEDGPVDETQAPLKYFVGKPYIMGHTTEFIAQHMDISREDMDEVALRSNNEVERATNDGSFADEIVPVEVKQRRKPSIMFDKDEHFRPNLKMEDLAKLPPAFVPKTGKVTAGNSSGINDGSTGMIIMSASKAKALGLTPIAKITGVGKGGCHPSVMGLSPVPAVNDLMKRSGLAIKDFDLVEVNEAFAGQYIACERDLGLDRSITNVNGSGIGLGHPVGSTGARLIVTLMHALKKRNKSTGLATLCGGGGVAMACSIEML